MILVKLTNIIQVNEYLCNIFFNSKRFFVIYNYKQTIKNKKK